MIISLTLNPSLDYVLQVESLALEETQRAVNSFIYAAGKAIDVSRVLTRLNVQTSAWGFIGGMNGDRFSRLLVTEGVQSSFIPCTDETRMNVIITDINTYSQLRISAKGPNITEDELNTLYNRVENLPSNTELVVIGGSIPQNVPQSVYKDLIEIIQAKGIRCLLDASSKSLALGIQAKPYLIKPNLSELCHIAEIEKCDNMEEVKIAATKIVKKGVENVVVSLGADGAIFVNDIKIIQAKAPDVEVKSKVGAGDSMVAGLVYGLHHNMSEEEMLSFGIACGTAAVLTTGTELANKKDIEEILPQVEITCLQKNPYM